MPSRAENEAKVRELRARGLLLREIAAEMRVGISTVDAWLNDPGGLRLRARKDSYRGECSVCSGPIYGSPDHRVRNPTGVCIDCTTWSKQSIIDAMRSWAESHGGIPPTGIDWKASEPDHPAADTVAHGFGWNQMLLAAGFSLRRDCRPETWEWIVEQLHAGVRTVDIAATLGCTVGNISRRAQARNTTISAIRKESVKP